MAKVIVERPRWGSSLRGKKKGYRKYLQKMQMTDLPRNEPLIGRWRGMGKHFSEHLGPMRRFLQSRVGRPWNKVHQELSENIDLGNVVQKHVMTHVYDYVERYAEYVGRVPVYAEGRRRGSVLPFNKMFVCPRSGILKIVDRLPAPKQFLRIGTIEFLYLLRDGVWWEVRLRPAPVEPDVQWDVWLECAVAKTSKRERQEAFGADCWATSKRPLSEKETREMFKKHRESMRTDVRSLCR
jgi:hypothetical protein